ncbi:MAG: hypothetical protein Nkreftii_003608 [Candidatus Nitrospira kreftii]|uniref:Asparagine synthetase domain-containing protein n=1 Tax=Candidatus Nitrospira kreftii TaxID=2652173 RepID=A0A7S8J1H4_9BACT|nr:MAG: hypothetical protein Nkreftii_003608 [Candidatus Nitrospira kreftii]
MSHPGIEQQCPGQTTAVPELNKAIWTLRSISNAQLPQLAWVAETDRLNGIVRLIHGPRVEVRESFFIEGVWNGPFHLGEFRTTDCVFGSGGLLIENAVHFVPSAATTDHLYYDETGDRVIVSNSLPLLLAHTQDRLDPHCRDYAAICHSILNGIHDYRRDIPTTGGKIRRLMYRNLEVSRDRVTELEKQMPPPFVAFAQYRDYLRTQYALIAANARDVARTWPLQIVSTQSRGYDSTAVNSLARASGIDKVFTVPTAKSKRFLAHHEEENLSSDDGGEICATLDLPCFPLNRRAFAENFDQEYLYYSALHHNQDANLMDIGNQLSTVSVLLTGVIGELWRPKADKVEWPCLNSDLRHGDLGGSGMGEWRLVVGLIHLPMPFIGARRRAEIVEITESAEMDPWRLRNSYDRPIARRLAEEAGVPRHLFGQYKMGSVVLFSQPSIPFGKDLRREFFNYLVAEKVMARPTTWLWSVVRRANTLLQVNYLRRISGIYFIERVLSKLIRRQVRFPQLWSRLDGSLYCFCVNRTADRYSAELRTSSEDSDAPHARHSTVRIRS